MFLWLTNALGIFMCWMNNDLHQFIGKFNVIYLQNIVILERTRDECLQHIRMVLKTLWEHNIFINVDKCNFTVNMKHTQYLTTFSMR